MSGTARNKTLGWSDVLAGVILFFLLSLALKAFFDLAVPGLLKDETLLQVQISGVMFLLFWALMGNFLFKPYIDLIIEREEKTVGLLEKAQEHKRNSRVLEEEIEGDLRQSRLAAIRERDRITDLARRKGQETLAHAVELAQEKRLKAQEEISVTKQQALLEVPKESEKLAKLVFERTIAAYRG